METTGYVQGNDPGKAVVVEGPSKNLVKTVTSLRGHVDDLERTVDRLVGSVPCDPGNPPEAHEPESVSDDIRFSTDVVEGMGIKISNLLDRINNSL